MKKIVSTILAVLVITGICVFPANAEEPLFKDEFYEYASWKLEPPYDDVLSYQELAYHDDESGALKWVLVQGETWYSHPTICYEVVGDRVFRGNNYYVPFDLSYGVYLAEEKTFMDIIRIRNQYRYEGAYSELYPEILEDLEKLNLGEKIGDLNGDGILNISDATQIQRCLAEYTAFPETDGVEAAGYTTSGQTSVAYLTDVNHDGKRSIRDVTEIQRILAEMN